MYADGTHVTVVSNNREDLSEKAQKQLISISEWMRTNKFGINQQKPEYMVTGHPWSIRL